MNPTFCYWTTILEYVPEYGILQWKKHRPSRRKSRLAGALTGEGYVQIKHRGAYFYVHRIIWEMHYGLIPDDREVDHKNRIRNDNRIENLRLVTRAENIRNSDRFGSLAVDGAGRPIP